MGYTKKRPHIFLKGASTAHLFCHSMRSRSYRFICFGRLYYSAGRGKTEFKTRWSGGVHPFSNEYMDSSAIPYFLFPSGGSCLFVFCGGVRRGKRLSGAHESFYLVRKKCTFFFFFFESGGFFPFHLFSITAADISNGRYSQFCVGFSARRVPRRAEQALIRGFTKNTRCNFPFRWSGSLASESKQAFWCKTTSVSGFPNNWRVNQFVSGLIGIGGGIILQPGNYVTKLGWHKNKPRRFRHYLFWWTPRRTRRTLFSKGFYLNRVCPHGLGLALLGVAGSWLQGLGSNLFISATSACVLCFGCIKKLIFCINYGRSNHISVYILAGGKSSRMGSDKVCCRGDKNCAARHSGINPAFRKYIHCYIKQNIRNLRSWTCSDVSINIGSCRRHSCYIKTL